MIINVSKTLSDMMINTQTAEIASSKCNIHIMFAVPTSLALTTDTYASSFLHSSVLFGSWQVSFWCITTTVWNRGWITYTSNSSHTQIGIGCSPRPVQMWLLIYYPSRWDFNSFSCICKCNFLSFMILTGLFFPIFLYIQMSFGVN